LNARGPLLAFATAAVLAAAAGLPGAAHAQSVALQGMLGGRALLIVDGSPPRSVAAGDSYKGVKVVSTRGDEAVVEIDGRRHTLRVGEAPASVGGSGAPRGNRITLNADSGGHFMALGAINGQSVRFMVDTGATAIGMGQAEASRLGVDFRRGQPIQLSTANGWAPGFLVKLNSVRVGDVELNSVDAIVSPQSMPFVLLGNSFLSRFQMRRENDIMVLERRY